MKPARILLALAVAIAVVTGLQAVLAMWESRSPTPSPSTTTATSISTPDGLLGEHPDYPGVVDHLDQVRARHAGKGSEDPEYHQAFNYLLTDLDVALMFEQDREGTARQHAATIARYRADIDTLEARYINREHLGRGVRITRSDGSVFEHDGWPTIHG